MKFWYEVSFDKIGFNKKNREEAKCSRKKWFPCNKGGGFRKWYGNNIYVANWENDGAEMTEFAGSVIRNPDFYFREGITWSSLTSGRLSMRYSPEGFLFESKGSVCFFKDRNNLEYILGLMNSDVISEIMLILSPTLDYHEGPMSRVPVLISDDDKTVVVELVNDCIKLCKDDWDSFETSWDFVGHPLVSYGFKTIEESYEKWKSDCDYRYEKVKSNEDKLNEIFSKIYGIKRQDSVENNLSVRKADKHRELVSLLQYAVGCMLGRYLLDVEGIVCAGGEWDKTKYVSISPDINNIIQITDEEYFEEDIVGKFCEWLSIAYGESTLEKNLDFIADALGNKGDTSRKVIRNYFLKDFMTDHLKIYQKRPIYWLFDSGKEDGFKALIYMHRYNPDTVGIVRTDYLHKTQRAVEQAMQRAEYTRDNATSGSDKAKATKQITKYTKQLAEMKSYDEAMAHIANQRIDIDLDDGVKVNYAKFQGVEVAQEGKKILKIDLLAKIK